MEHTAKSTCKTVISGKEQNLNKQMAEFGTFSILHVHFGQIPYWFKVLEIRFTIQYFQYSVGTL